jgi:hypothetical protein
MIAVLKKRKQLNNLILKAIPYNELTAQLNFELLTNRRLQIFQMKALRLIILSYSYRNFFLSDAHDYDFLLQANEDHIIQCE